MAEDDLTVHRAASEAASACATVEVGARRMSIEDVVAIACARAGVALNADADWRARIERGAAFLRERLAAGATVYGVNTGYGDACVVNVPPELVEALPLQLTRYHGCGMGRLLDSAETRAVIAARLNSLAYGYSGVRVVLLERLADLINFDILPRIPAEGSVTTTEPTRSASRMLSRPVPPPTSTALIRGSRFTASSMAAATATTHRSSARSQPR